MVEQGTPENLFPTPVSESQTGEVLVPQIPQIDIPRDSRGRIRWRLLHEQGQIIDILQNEIRFFHEQYGEVTPRLLIQNHRSDLAGAVQHYYPGSWRQLRRDVKIPPHNIQDKGLRGIDPSQKAEEIEKYGLFLMKKGVNISHQALVEAGEDWYRRSIIRYYSGGIKALRDKLSVTEGKATRGRDYWTKLDNIEEEAQIIYEEYGDLTASIIRNAGKEDLMGGIFRHYPGKLTGLKEKIVTMLDPKVMLSPEEANEQLRRLLEVV